VSDEREVGPVIGEVGLRTALPQKTPTKSATLLPKAAMIASAPRPRCSLPPAPPSARTISCAPAATLTSASSAGTFPPWPPAGCGTSPVASDHDFYINVATTAILVYNCDLTLSPQRAVRSLQRRSPNSRRTRPTQTPMTIWGIWRMHLQTRSGSRSFKAESSTYRTK
jgi:hypothetical protein